MGSQKILYVCQEVTPYLAETPETLLCRELLQAMQERGNEIRTFMPRYGLINERRNQLHEVIRLSGMNLIIDDNDHQLIIKVASIPSARVQIYFIDNDDYFARKAVLTSPEGEEFADNDERSIFFARGVLETVKKLRWEPSIVHCHGWFSFLVAAYLRNTFADDPIFKGVKIVVSFNDKGFNDPLDSTLVSKLENEGIEGEQIAILEEPTYENLCRCVLSYADGVVLSSGNVDTSLVKAVRQSGKPVLEYQSSKEADFFDNYDKFYESL
ncbi:MAG: glycogen/starch synthase [Rikenellaceae bacterium]